MFVNKAFKMYDIRAVVGRDFFVEDVFDLGRALATFVHNKDKNIKKVVIGMDVRTHSNAIKDQLIEGFVESGFDVVFIGECPSPVLYFALYHLNAPFGVMITASHNSKEYNGFKIVLNNKPVWGDDIQIIKDVYNQKQFMSFHSTGFETELDINHVYINYLAEKFKHLYGIEINSVIDCCNGTASLILPKLAQKMGWKNYKLLFDSPDGNFPNHEPDPTQEEALRCVRESITNNNLKYGLCFDGDCDRFVVVDSDLKKLEGDELLAFFTLGLEQPSVVVCDVQCSSSLNEFALKNGHNIEMVPTGCCHIKNKMYITSAMLGGEMSGHYCFKDKYFGFDDGIYAMMRFIEILNFSNKSTHELLAGYSQKLSSDSIRIKCAEIDVHELVEKVKKDFIGTNQNLNMIDGIRIENGSAWGIARASNTEPILSMRFQAATQQELKEISKLFYDIISKYYDSEDLKKNLL